MTNDRKENPLPLQEPKMRRAPPDAPENANDGRTDNDGGRDIGDVERQTRTSKSELALDKALTRLPPG